MYTGPVQMSWAGVGSPNPGRGPVGGTVSTDGLHGMPSICGIVTNLYP